MDRTNTIFYTLAALASAEILRCLAFMAFAAFNNATFAKTALVLVASTP